LVWIGGLLLIPAVLYLARIARAGSRRTTAVGMVLAVVGCVGMAGVGVISAVMGQVVRHTDPAVARTVWDYLVHDLGLVDLPVLLGGLGFVVLAVGLWRETSVPKPAAIAVGLGGLATLVTSQGPIRPLLVASTLVLLVGTAWIAAGEPTEELAPAAPDAARREPVRDTMMR
jgi:hypothetical protein